MKSLSVLLIGLACAGCVSNKVWYNPNKTADECRHDYMQCKYDAERSTANAEAGPIFDPISQGVSVGLEQQKLIQDCMALKGYQLIDKSQMPFGSTIEH